METMHAAGRRRLPPVPRPAPARAVADRTPAPEPDPDGPVTERLALELTEGEPETADDDGPTPERAGEDGSSDDDSAAGLPDATEAPEPDASQEFVTRLRSAAADFAEAAGAASAVVREAVPPARHRRARCRLVLRYTDGSVTDVTFLGPAGVPGTRSRHGFDRQIRRWLGSGQHREDAWVVADPDASDGVAVDVTAWLSAG